MEHRAVFPISLMKYFWTLFWACVDLLFYQLNVESELRGALEHACASKTLKQFRELIYFLLGGVHASLGFKKYSSVTARRIRPLSTPPPPPPGKRYQTTPPTYLKYLLFSLYCSNNYSRIVNFYYLKPKL